MKKRGSSDNTLKRRSTLFKRYFCGTLKTNTVKSWCWTLPPGARDTMPLRGHAKVRVGMGERSWKKKVFPSVIQQLWSTVTCQVTEVALGLWGSIQATSDIRAAHRNYGLVGHLGELCNSYQQADHTVLGEIQKDCLCLQRKPSFSFT